MEICLIGYDQGKFVTFLCCKCVFTLHYLTCLL